MEFIPTEKGQTIRLPSTANLCIDSNDRKGELQGITDLDSTSPYDFQIQKNTNILTGFFTRITTAELYLDWCEPNIEPGTNDYFSIYDKDVDTNYTINIADGFYTVKQLLDYIVLELNQIADGTVFSIVNDAYGVRLKSSTHAISVNVLNPVFNNRSVKYEVNNLTTQLFAGNVDAVNRDLTTNELLLVSPDLRLWRYLDFISTDLTYNQELKDSSTNKKVIDTLCRFYMANENMDVSAVDGYGFPILLGYKPFQITRMFRTPKNIKWSPNMPLGNLRFQVYGNTNIASLVNENIPLRWNKDNPNNTSYCMTLLVSEV